LFSMPSVAHRTRHGVPSGLCSTVIRCRCSSGLKRSPTAGIFPALLNDVHYRRSCVDHEDAVVNELPDP
jgi:hypothetical protein